MKQIIDYKLLYGTGSEVTQWVVDMIAEGWQPLGPAQPDRSYVHQTMVKYHPTNNV